MKRIKGLYKILISRENLSRAIDEVNDSHHWKKGHKGNSCTAWVHETKEERIKELREIIEAGFVQKEPHVTQRYDASARKWRVVSEPVQWPDQYIHHALIQVLEPVMMRGMDHYCCGSIEKRGPLHAKRGIEKWLVHDRRGTRYELCGDVRHFYDSLTPEIVMNRMRELVKDHRTLDLIWRVIKDGIMIGAYTSQWFANTVLQPMDMMIRQSGLCSHYVRYMDNLTILGSNKRNLHKLRRMIEAWLNEHDLKLKGDWQVFPVVYDDEKKRRHPKGRRPDAVGYKYGRGYTLPRKHNYYRIKRAVNRIKRKEKREEPVSIRMANGTISRLGQMKHCNNYNLYRNIFEGDKVVRRLKKIVRRSQKEVITWSMFLEQRAIRKSLRQKDLPIAG